MMNNYHTRKRQLNSQYVFDLICQSTNECIQVQEKIRQAEEATGKRPKTGLGVDALLANVLERKQSVEGKEHSLIY